MAFYCTKHDPNMDYFSSEAYLISLEGKNHNQDVNKTAQRKIEIVDLH